MQKAKIVPTLLNNDQKGRHMQVLQNMIEYLQPEPELILKVNPSAEYGFWVRYGNQSPEQSVEVIDVTEAEENKTVKVMLITFYVHNKFLSQGQIINRQVFKKILRRILWSVCEKRRGLWKDKSWLLPDDNAPAHNVLCIQKNTTLLEYSPF